MSENFKPTKADSAEASGRNCWNWMNTLQVSVGLLLLVATAYGSSLINHPILMLPGIMGASLAIYGAKTLIVCRGRLSLHHHHSTARILG